ncbi:Membrane protein involved in the export of O-antigen and teichoic acid [Flagellimonas zhangzhouensis]|uniref:Membrane protein involved in the export of O-antigen and teichoic acid n=2 Tax=Flagellimonas zhangzhouensis TaxID=1073328 RepID=A0A1H2UQB7_9FLAO|nr:Membrane protein involved in the export of O-antigen and teichoic acid [Allomuricauda zhangzhouensis]SDW57769.1 Membrane protein involved in the export of O-antigen and teichoic acid [Allomuricauda zhangzhouensis]
MPRVISFFLLPLYTAVFENASGYGQYTNIYAWIAIFNVFLAYGMETAFFRFYHKSQDKAKVISTSLISLMASSLLFLILALSIKQWLSDVTNINVDYLKFTTYILVLDALVIIPFALLRANEKPMRYAVLKTINVAINLGFNVFFLLILPNLAQEADTGLWNSLHKPNWEIHYVLISNVIASAITLLILVPSYFKASYSFDAALWKQMLKYAGPVMLAGVAFTINEVLDKILLTELLPSDIAESEVGKYGACYKLALFMTLFGTAFRMGVEPFFFSHAKTEKPQKTYAQITNYFVIMGSIILLGVVVFIDVLGKLLLHNPVYWEALDVVPIILLGSFCLGIYHNLSVWYKVTDQTKFGAYISSFGALLTLIINIWFIPKIGYMASALATLAAYGSMMVLSYYFGRKYYPVPYNMRKITFYLGVSILFSALSFYVFNRNLIAGSVLLLLFLGLVYKMEGDNLRSIFLKRGD